MTTENQNLHPVGNFTGILKNAVVGEASTGTKFIGLLFQTNFGKTRMQLWLTPNNADRVKQDLANNFDWIAGVNTLADLKAKAETQCQLVISHEEYKGKMQERVSFVANNSIYEDAEAEKVLADLFGGTTDTKTKTTQEPTQAPAPNDDNDDDVPF